MDDFTVNRAMEPITAIFGSARECGTVFDNSTLLRESRTREGGTTRRRTSSRSIIIGEKQVGANRFGKTISIWAELSQVSPRCPQSHHA